MSRAYQQSDAFRSDPGRQIDLGAMYAAMDEAARCICEWDIGPCRTPNLRCPVHGLADAAAEALGRILGGA
jgi:hypothetical protein